MSWRKHFKPVDEVTSGKLSPVGSTAGVPGPARVNYSSFLPDVYYGAPNRIERYQQLDIMSLDSEVTAALDILTEFCCQKDRENGTPFQIQFRGHPTSTETRLIKEALQRWCRLQKFEVRIFRIIRNTFLYGDCFFVRDPETKKWLYVDPVKVVKIIANESEGKIPEQYVLRDINFNFSGMIATTPHETTNTQPSGNVNYTTTGGFGGGNSAASTQSPGTRFQNQLNETTVDAENVVHISMSEGLDDAYPFGKSILESVFKVYKQKELLEDAIVIYRIQRAPERRIFYIDVGNMPAHMAMGFVERVKNEIQQRRIPSSTGGGNNVIDASYNPLSSNEDFFFPQTCLALDTKIKLIDGRNLSLTEIINEHNQGIINYTYSVNQTTHRVSPGRIAWADITRKNTQVVKVVLNTSDHVVCTPDHRFIIADGNEVEAQHLTHGDAIMSMYSSHTVESVNWLEKTIDTGDITICSYNNDHNFALECGIFVHNSEGRGSKVDTLPGGTNLGEITDLRYFTNKLFRALRIPASYLPTTIDESPNVVADGKVGTAYIQELRFNEYCKRLQNLFAPTFDTEFKLWLHHTGLNIDNSLFELRFSQPQNFAAYRQAELDVSRVSLFSQIQDIPFLSKRFAMKRFLGMSPEEIAENEMMWREENSNKQSFDNDSSGQMRDIGVTAGGIDADMSAFDSEAPDDMADEAGESLSGMEEPSEPSPGQPTNTP